jgi:hypothetical protein
MSSNDGILLSRLPSPPSSIMVGHGHSIPVFSRGTSSLHLADRTFHLHNVLVAPQLARNLLSVRQFTRDNNCSIEFDASGFSVKDLQTKTVLQFSFGAIATGTSTLFHITCLLTAMSLSSPRSCATPALVIQHQQSSPPYISFHPYSVIKQPAVFVTLASLANTLGCPLLVRFRVPQHLLNSFIVMCGPLRSQVFLVINFILC